MPPIATTLGLYDVRLKDQNGVQVAVFDNWVSLQYTNEVNGLGEFQFVIQGNDSRRTLFELDGQVEIWRCIPGMGIGWYLDFEGFHRKDERQTKSDGSSVFISRGVGYNDLLARTVIGYKEGTIRAEKNAPVESAMKEYVRENCTSLGDTTVVGRLNYDEHLNDDDGAMVYEVGLPGFSVEIDEYRGPVWRGERAYENLLGTLQDMAATTGVDFRVVGTGAALFNFKTYINGMGIDHRYDWVDPYTGLNAAGNTPIKFSVPFGTVQNITYISDRLKESNAVMVLGAGELSLREVYTVADPVAIAASPWNRREITRPGSNQEFDYQFRQIGNEALVESSADVGMEFDPLQTESHCYGIHYRIGDIVTAQYDDILMHKKITKIAIGVDNNGEKINVDFADV